MDSNNFVQEQRLKAALHHGVGYLCKDFEQVSGIKVDKPVIAAINELTYQQLGLYAKDLEDFSKHARRSTVNADDVRLLARKNPVLLNHIESLISHDGVKATAEAGKKGRKKANDNREQLE